MWTQVRIVPTTDSIKKRSRVVGQPVKDERNNSLLYASENGPVLGEGAEIRMDSGERGRLLRMSLNRPGVGV